MSMHCSDKTGKRRRRECGYLWFSRVWMCLLISSFIWTHCLLFENGSARRGIFPPLPIPLVTSVARIYSCSLQDQKKFQEQFSKDQEPFGASPSPARQPSTKKVVGPGRANGGANGSSSRRLSLNAHQNGSRSINRDGKRDTRPVAPVNYVAMSKEDAASHISGTDTLPATPWVFKSKIGGYIFICIICCLDTGVVMILVSDLRVETDCMRCLFHIEARLTRSSFNSNWYLINFNAS